jgi:hypothetical protein
MGASSEAGLTGMGPIVRRRLWFRVAVAVLQSARVDKRQGGMEVGALGVLLARKMVAQGQILAERDVATCSGLTTVGAGG